MFFNCRFNTPGLNSKSCQNNGKSFVHLCHGNEEMKLLEIMDNIPATIDQITQRLRHMMESLGITAKTFAERAGIPPATFSQTLENRNKPSLATLLKIAKGFPEWSPTWIFFGEGDERVEISKNREGLFLDSSFENTYNTSVYQRDANNIDRKSPVEDSLSSREISEDLISRVVSETLLQQTIVEEKSISEIRVFYSDGSFETFVLK